MKTIGLFEKEVAILDKGLKTEINEEVKKIPSEKKNDLKKGVRKEIRRSRKTDRDYKWEREELHMTKLVEERHRRHKPTPVNNASAKLEQGFARPTTPIVHEVVLPSPLLWLI